MSAGAAATPAPTGPHPTGALDFYWQDDTRPDPLTGPPAAARQVAAQIVYPAATQGAAAPYLPECAEILAWLAVYGWRDGEARILTDLYGELRSHSTAGAPAAKGHFPIVLLSPGGYQSRRLYTGMAEEIASHGYAAVLLGHPFAGLDFFPGLGLLGRHAVWTAPAGLAGKAALDAFYEPMTEILAADASFTLDRLRALDEGHPVLGGRLDLSLVAIAGHSRGGKTVSRACSTDTRIGAAIVLDNLPPRRELTGGFRAPLMMMRIDDPAEREHWPRAGRPARWTAEDKAAARRLVETNPAPAYDLTLRDIGHMNFSDRALVERDRFRAPADPAQARSVICAYLIAFLDRHLKNTPPAPILTGARRWEIATLFANNRT